MKIVILGAGAMGETEAGYGIAFGGIPNYGIAKTISTCISRPDENPSSAARWGQ